MGCGESKTLSKQPGKSVVVQDTHIAEYDDDWSNDQVKKTANGHGASKTVKSNKTVNNNKENKNINNNNNNNNNYESKTSNEQDYHVRVGTTEQKPQLIAVSSSTIYGPKHTKKVPQKSQNITHMVDLEEYE